MKGPGGPRRAGTPIVLGVALLVIALAVIELLPSFIAAIVLGVLVAAVACFVILMAMHALLR